MLSETKFKSIVDLKGKKVSERKKRYILEAEKEKMKGKYEVETNYWRLKFFKYFGLAINHYENAAEYYRKALEIDKCIDLNKEILTTCDSSYYDEDKLIKGKFFIELMDLYLTHKRDVDSFNHFLGELKKNYIDTDSAKYLLKFISRLENFKKNCVSNKFDINEILKEIYNFTIKLFNDKKKLLNPVINSNDLSEIHSNLFYFTIKQNDLDTALILGIEYVDKFKDKKNENITDNVVLILLTRKNFEKIDSVLKNLSVYNQPRFNYLKKFYDSFKDEDDKWFNWYMNEWFSKYEKHLIKKVIAAKKSHDSIVEIEESFQQPKKTINLLESNPFDDFNEFKSSKRELNV